MARQHFGGKKVIGSRKFDNPPTFEPEPDALCSRRGPGDDRRRILLDQHERGSISFGRKSSLLSDYAKAEKSKRQRSANNYEQE
jgi:hypothetical protein